MGRGASSFAVRVAWLGLALLGCGKSRLSQSFEDAARKQIDIDNMTLSLWKRSPTSDSANLSTNAESDLESITRSSVVFTGVKDIKSDIRSTDIVVYQSPTKKTGTTFYRWAGEYAPVSDPAFQVLMTYYNATKARALASALFPDVSFAVSTNKIFPLTVYALEDGAVTGTNYDPSDKTIHLMYDSTSALPTFRVADEGDSVHHEFGHVVQDGMNATVLSSPIAGFLDLPPYNRDLDSILEALADVYAASTSRDENILQYLANNLPTLLSPATRTGSKAYKRTLSNTLVFPDAYVRNPHLDGRVVASALNDLRKYLAGQTVKMAPGCTSSCTSLTLSTGKVADAEAWNRVLTLGFRAYELMSTTSTFFEYATLLLSTCSSSSDVSSWCTTEVKTALAAILNGRGLKGTSQSANNVTLKWGEEAAGVLHASTPASGTADLYFYQALGFVPFPDDAGFSNEDSTIDRCEVMMIFPNLKNNSGTEAYYDMTVELLGISGFTNLLNPADKTKVEEVVNYSSAARKVVGWLQPGELSTLADFVLTSPNSRWYKEQNGAYFAQKLSSDYFPSEMGWLVRAPSAASGIGTAMFRLTARRYNSTTLNNNNYAIFTQKLTVSADTTRPSYCGN